MTEKKSAWPWALLAVFVLAAVVAIAFFATRETKVAASTFPQIPKPEPKAPPKDPPLPAPPKPPPAPVPEVKAPIVAVVPDVVPEVKAA